MLSARNHVVCAVVGTAWAAAVAFGLSVLWKYESIPGDPAQPPMTWPAETRVSRAAGLPSLVVIAHPRCPCSRATIDELSKLMTHCQGKLTATVLVVRPQGTPAGWERTGLWDSAAAIPGVSVMADDGGAESRRFGAATSGQALLFAANGRLLFAGGITESRGHSGDNDGRSAVLSLVLDGGPLTHPVHTPVYGCPLFDKLSTCPKEGAQACLNR